MTAIHLGWLVEMQAHRSGSSAIFWQRPRISTCDRFDSVGANGSNLARRTRSRTPAPAILPWRRAHDPLEGRAESALGLVAKGQGNHGNWIARIHDPVPGQQHSP